MQSAEATVFSSNQGSANIVDIPLEPGGSDSLGIIDSVEALAEFIRRADTPVTLSIQGEWGSGKTSVMNQLKQKLCTGEPEECCFRPIWLNIWKMSLMHSPEETLVEVIQEIIKQIQEIMLHEYKRKVPILTWIKEIPIFKWPTDFFIKKLKRYVIPSALALGARHFGLGNLFQINATDEDGLIIQPRYGSIIELQQKLENAIEKCYTEDLKSKKGLRGFLFFVDDLDRLDPSVAVSVLELLKNVFECKHCVFILAIDYEVVVRGLVPKFGELTDKNERQFRSFFDKIIQLPFIMPVQRYDVKKYVDNGLTQIGYFSQDELKKFTKVKDIDFSINGSGSDKEQNIEVGDCAVKLIKLSTGQNPRSMIRLINSLSLNRIMWDRQEENSITDCSQKLANLALTCMQISYGIIYTLLQNKPSFVDWDEEFANSSRLPSLTETKEQLGLNETEEQLIPSENDEDGGDYEEGGPWQTVIERAVKNNVYLRQRTDNIEILLKVIAKLVTGLDVSEIEKDKEGSKSEDLGNRIGHLLSFSAITDASSQVSTVEKKVDTKFTGTVELLIGKVKTGKLFDDNYVNYLSNLLKRCIETCDNKVYVDSSHLDISKGKSYVSLKLQPDFMPNIRKRTICAGTISRNVIQFPVNDSVININSWKIKKIRQTELDEMTQNFLAELHYNFKMKIGASDVIHYDDFIEKVKKELTDDHLIGNKGEIAKIEEMLKRKYPNKFSEDLVPYIHLSQNMGGNSFLVQGFCLSVTVSGFLDEYIDNILPYCGTQDKDKLGSWTNIRDNSDLDKKPSYYQVKFDKLDLNNEELLRYIRDKVIERIDTTIEIYRKVIDIN